MFEINEGHITNNRDRMLYNIMTLLEIQANNKPNKPIKKDKGSITPQKVEKPLKWQSDLLDLELDIMTRQALFKLAKEHDIKVKATSKTDELRKQIKKELN